MTRRRPTLLFVDDDEVCVMAFERAVAARDVPMRVHIARDGDDALTDLRTPGLVKRPVVMLLDLNMPRLSGLDVLKDLRDDPQLCETVAFVLTTSDAPQDIKAAYAHNAAGYIVKDDAYRSIGAAVDLIGHYGELVTLPD